MIEFKSFLAKSEAKAEKSSEAEQRAIAGAAEADMC
jgi:hypothetical protein